jgi:hypothetical protein
MDDTVVVYFLQQTELAQTDATMANEGHAAKGHFAAL